MKALFGILIFVSFTTSISGQSVAINSTGSTPHPAAILDISSQDKGILIPRMTSAERLAIVNPPSGLLVFDETARSFWFYNAGWHEFVSSGDLGDAGGDLYGPYPNPFVGKLHGHPVSALTPSDGQVMKWDSANYMWKGSNDSLSLPFIVTDSNPFKLFSITNTYYGLTPSTAIHAQSGESSGITPPTKSGIWGDAFSGIGLIGTSNTHVGAFGSSETSHGVFGQTNGGGGIAGVRGTRGAGGVTPAATMGVWGENSDGIGVVGTSNSGVGVYGFSLHNHGLYGYGTNPSWAGIKGSHASDGGIGVLGELSVGTGVMGQVSQDGVGVLGKATASQGVGGAFYSTAPNHTDTTFIASTAGLGLLGLFQTGNAANDKPSLEVKHAGVGNGLRIHLTNPASGANGVHSTVDGGGTAVYGKSTLGIAARFENTNPANSYAPVVITNQGTGTSLYVNSSNTGLTGSVIDVINLGNGTGLGILSDKGPGASISIANPISTSRALSVTNSGLGMTALFKNTNTALDSGVVRIEQAGLGNGLSIIVANQNSQTSALSIISAADWGINSTVFGQHAIHGFALGASGIGVEGKAAGTSGIGVMGSSSASQGGVGVLGLANANDPQGVGVKGSAGRYGVIGEVVQDGGVSVNGRIGPAVGNATAGSFRNQSTANYFPILDVETNGLGRTLQLKSTNPSNATTVVQVLNYGTGGFLELGNADDTKLSISSNGDIQTQGHLYVKGGKGIVRNSTGTQLRTEIITVNIPAGSVSHYDQFNSWNYVPVNFTTSFSSAPSVFIGNVVSGGLLGLSTRIINVTTTGGALEISNYTSNDFTYPATTIKVIAIGPE